MALDPVTALAVAGNVVQFVDFTCKLLSKSHEVREHGGLVQSKHFHRYAQQISDFISVLEDRLRDVQHGDPGQPLSAERDRSPTSSQQQVTRLLRPALDHCKECAAELLKATSQLTVSGRNSVWHSFRQALSSIMGEDALHMMAQRLSQAQQNVVLSLVLYTSSSIAANFQSSSSLEKNILSAIIESTNRLREQVESLRKQIERVEPSGIESFASTAFGHSVYLWDSVFSGISQALPLVAREKFLRSLSFERISDRHDMIAPAHYQTFQWILESSGPDQAMWANFSSWLTAEGDSENLFWVTGKPGSGKSTLMRYLADSQRTREIIATWAAPTPIQILSCFFWHLGSIMQRSMKGLLRTLAYQALSNGSIGYDILQKLSPTRWHSCMYSMHAAEDWSLSELTVLLASVLKHLSNKMKLVFFVDGLDEFGTDSGERETLVRLFLDLKKLPNTKLCLSSRPWNEFKDSFDSFPQLRLEDLTRQDMQNFVEAEFGNSRAVQDLAHVAGDSIHELQEQLVTKAQGVFLWLFLVTKRLRLAAQDGIRLRKLFEILDQMPPDLNDFFQLMLERISPCDRVQASKIFQLMLAGDQSALPTLIELSFTDEEGTDFALVPAIRSEHKGVILHRIDTFRRRFLDSQCMDLLVCAPTDQKPGRMWENNQVDYLHRTVKDFLETRPSQKLLLSYTVVPLDVLWYKCNAAVVEMMFANKFITRQLSATYEQHSIQKQCFQKYLQHFWCCTRADLASAKQIFETAVDEFDFLLQSQAPRNFRHQSLSPGSGGSKAAELVREAYEKVRLSCSTAVHPYLLMALIAGLTTYAESYIAGLPAGTSMLLYFQSALAPAVPSQKGVDPGLLVQIVQREPLFSSIEEALGAITKFCDVVRRSNPDPAVNLPLQESYGKVTKLLVHRTQGLSGTNEQLLNFKTKLQTDSRTTFHHSIASPLIKQLKKTQKTWKTIKTK